MVSEKHTVDHQVFKMISRLDGIARGLEKFFNHPKDISQPTIDGLNLALQKILEIVGDTAKKSI